MRLRLAGIGLTVLVAVVLSACASEEVPGGPEGPTVVAVYANVNWYPPCATSPIELGGDLYYPLPMGAPPVDESLYPVPTGPACHNLGSDEPSVALAAGLPRVVPPGPGDDIGCVIVYSDGVARFESHSGNVAWLTRKVQEYGYVC